MTCYLRHLKEIFRKAEIEVTKEKRQELDRIIHSMVEVEYKSCPKTWREVKKRIADDEENFVSKLREVWRKQEDI